jgi:hypothetical protein
MRLIRSLLSASALLAGLLATIAVPPAQAATAGQAGLPNVKAELSAAIGAQLKYNPAGKVIDRNQISYDHGGMIVTLAVRGEAVSPDFVCPNGDVCFFTEPGLKGSAYEVNPSHYSEDTFYSLQTWYPHNGLGSVHNKWSHRIFISRHNPPNSGANLCYPPTGSGSPDQVLAWMYFGKSDTC